MSGKFFCLRCGGTFDNDSEQNENHFCNPIFKMVGGTLNEELSVATGIKRHRWRRMIDKFFQLDIGWWLSFLGLIMMNSILISHCNLSFKVTLLESFCLGLAIPRLLNKD